MEFLLFLGLVAYIFYNEKRISKTQDQIEQLQKEKLLIELKNLNPHTTEKELDSNVTSDSELSDSRLPGDINIKIEPDSLEKFWIWLVRDWPMKVGALFIILSAVWFVAYAFLNNWIGPAGRITLGLITGSTIMVVGHWYATRQRHQGLIIELLGTGINLITIFSAQNLYHMFPPTTALLLSVGVMITLAYSSLVYNDRFVAIFALIIGGLAPLLTGSYEPNIFGLFSYLTALTIGSLWLSAFTNWRHLTTVNLAMIWFYSLPYQTGSYRLLGYNTPLEIIQLKFFAISFVSLFFAANIATIYKNRIAKSADLITALALSLYSFSWIVTLVPTQWQSLITLALAMSFFLGAYITSQSVNSPYPVYTYSASSLFLLTAATIIEFDGPIEVVCLSLIAALIPLVSLHLFNQQISAKILLYFTIPIFLSLPSITSSTWNKGIIHNDAGALLTLTACLWAVGLYLRYQLPKTVETVTSQLKDATVAILIIASIYSLTLIWLINHASLPETFVARMITVAIYLVVGLFTYFFGQLNHRKILNRYGQILTGLVIAWLLLVETSSMELSGRILTFALTGVLLMGSVVLLNRFKKNSTL